MVERITITIKKELLRKIDGIVDGKDVRNRSHAIETLLSRSLTKTGIDTALIMAGGEGAHLRPITYEIPKPLIPVKGKPILEHQINFLKRNGIANILIAADYMSDKIRDHFGSGERFGVDINYLTESRPMGTAGALGLVKKYVNKNFLMLNVDTLMDPNITEMHEFHKRHKKLATVMLTTVDNPSDFGVVRMRGNQILNFVEKPKGGAPSKLVNAGLCVFDSAVMDYIPKRRMMIEELFTRLSKENQLAGFLHDGPTFDVGTRKGYETAIKNWNSHA